MDSTTWKLIESIPQVIDLEAAEISGKRWSTMPFKDYRTLEYPEFDICTSALENPCDILLAEQVWEHLTRPYQATRNVLNSPA